MHGQFSPQSGGTKIYVLTLSDLDKHLGDLYPSIIGMFSIVIDEIGSNQPEE